MNTLYFETEKGLTGGTNTIDATSMHSTSCQKLSQEEAEFNCKVETTRPWKFPHPRNLLICRNQMCAPTGALGVVIHYMRRDFNALLGNSNVR